MKKSDFYFDLPKELIAQKPIERRELSRLLFLDRKTGETGHHHFYELTGFLRKGDCLVLNDSRVIPARLLGRKESGGAAEILLLREVAAQSPATWECMVRPGRKIRPGTKLFFGDGELTATVTDTAEGGNRIVEFHQDGDFLQVLESLGKTPLPPYIREELEDGGRYQTVYSRVNGSVAAPTAGLHFTKELLAEISAFGVKICYITLHVGPGTFRPVKANEIEEHKMHAEHLTITEETAATINRTKADGARVIAVGTTSCRTLESNADSSGKIKAFCGFTDIFIYPGYVFKCIDGLLTNFHLPESTLIMLVSAFAGRENVLKAYSEAVCEKYRFFSFGDAMLIV